MSRRVQPARVSNQPVSSIAKTPRSKPKTQKRKSRRKSRSQRQSLADLKKVFPQLNAGELDAMHKFANYAMPYGFTGSGDPRGWSTQDDHGFYIVLDNISHDIIQSMTDIHDAWWSNCSEYASDRKVLNKLKKRFRVKSQPDSLFPW